MVFRGVFITKRNRNEAEAVFTKEGPAGAIASEEQYRALP
jgi:hypothetical protein